MKQTPSLVRRLSWLCLALSLITLAAFAWYVPPVHDRFRIITKANLPGFAGFVRGLPSVAFLILPAGLGILALGVQFRLNDRAAAAIVHLLIVVVALFVFVAHREAILGWIEGLSRLVK